MSRKLRPSLQNFRFHLVFLLVSAFYAGEMSSQDLTDSNLPIVIITTDININTGQPTEIPDDPRVFASMKIIKRPDGSRNYVVDQNTAAFLNYNGRINIEVRGSTSQFPPKKAYGLSTLEDDNLTNNNVALLGMPSENDWILNGLAFDPSLIRDYLSADLSRQLGNYAPRANYCEVIINGDYRGLYLLQEKIKADSNRLNIVKITPADNTTPAITGGYITKADKTTGGDPVAWTMPSYAATTEYIHDLPKPEEVTGEQDSYIHSRFLALASTSQFHIDNLVTGYPSIIDVPTFVDFMVINEIAANVDAYQLSTYFHQDRNGKLRAGPIWDFNLSYGNDVFGDRSKTDTWQFYNNDNTGSKFWKDLFDDAAFKCYLARRWNDLIQTDQPLKHNNLVTRIDGIVTQIAEATVRENARWGTVQNHVQEIDNIKMFLYLRILWMTANIGSDALCNNITTPPLVINRINYNPGTSGTFPVSNDQEFVEIKNAGNITYDLTGYYFRELGMTYQFPPNMSIASGESIFLASNATVFENRYGILAFGQFTRNLSNKSHKLILADGFGNEVDFVQYLDSAPWPDADGNGSWLVLNDVALDNSLASSWSAENQTTLSVDQFNLSGSINVFPNPSSGKLSITSSMLISSVKLFDLSGRMLLNKSPQNIIWDADISDFSNGIYLLQIDFGTKSVTRKILKK